nr:MAG TPA: hypothetical protein [Caudoviricetes sp.]
MRHNRHNASLSVFVLNNYGSEVTKCQIQKQ